VQQVFLPPGLIQDADFMLLHRAGASDHIGKRPQSLLCAGSRAARLKTSVSGIPYHLQKVKFILEETMKVWSGSR
jgi:hypothetical protein